MKRILSAIFLVVTVIVNAQDAHFSQYFSSALYTNPALTGQINGNYRIGGNFRTQWNSFGDAYTSASVSADTRLDNGFGIGVVATDLITGNSNYSNVNFALSGSYDLAAKTNSTNHLVFGLQLGIINRSINDGNVTVPDQYVPGFGVVNPVNEDFGSLSKTTPDANFGVLWFNGKSSLKWTPFVGAAAFHLIPVDDSFNQDEKLPIRYQIHGGARYRTTSSIDITPHASFQYQGGAYNGLIGANISYGLIDTEVRLEGGLAYRIEDAVVPYLGVIYQDFQFGVSFDTNLSAISDIGRTKNATEFSLIYTNRKNTYQQKYICPRL